MFLAWSLVLLFRPHRFLHAPDEARPPDTTSDLLAAVVGIYGGFLQAGVGFPMIALLAGQLGCDLLRANSVKVSLLFVFTLVAFPLFVLAEQVAWIPAIVLALGTLVGGWFGARWQVDKGGELVRWFVLVMVTVSGIAVVADASELARCSLRRPRTLEQLESRPDGVWVSAALV